MNRITRTLWQRRAGRDTTRVSRENAPTTREELAAAAGRTNVRLF